MTYLVPVKDWIWSLWKVTYHESEDAPPIARLTKYTVCTDTHIEGEVLDYRDWPSTQAHFARWEIVVDHVPAPRDVSSFYNMPLSESGWAAGQREAEKRGLAR